MKKWITKKSYFEDGELYKVTEFGTFGITEINEVNIECAKVKFGTLPNKYVVDSWNLHGYKYCAFAFGTIVQYNSVFEPIAFCPIQDGSIKKTIEKVKTGKLVISSHTND